ncbi:hypothetical protein GIB67_008077, partial [Kingdonia uniflora]
LLVHPNLTTHLIHYRSLIGSSQFDHPSNTLQIAYWFIPIRPTHLIHYRSIIGSANSAKQITYYRSTIGLSNMTNTSTILYHILC